jgi:hypothetical protein
MWLNIVGPALIVNRSVEFISALTRREPSVAANQDHLASRVMIAEVGLDFFPVFRRQVTDNFRDASAMAGSSQSECALDCLRLRHDLPYGLPRGGTKTK